MKTLASCEARRLPYLVKFGLTCLVPYLYAFALTTILLQSCRQEQDTLKEGTQPQQAEQTAVMPVIPEFNATRSFDYLLKQTSFGPRNPGSRGHAECRRYLMGELGRLANRVRVQDFTHHGYDGERLSLTNIIGVFNPSATQRILLCAHWDTRPRAEHDEDPARWNEPIIGANDGASGVAVLLEIANHLKTSPPAIGVDIVFFDGEDYGKEGDTQNYLLGSRYFAKNREQDYVPRFGILLDMVGDKYLEIPKEESSTKFAPDIVDLVWKKAKELGMTQFIDAVGEAVIDDHLPLNEAGIKTIDIIDFNYPDPTHRFWHTHNDVPENCSSESLAAVGTVVMHVVYAQRP